MSAPEIIVLGAVLWVVAAVVFVGTYNLLRKCNLL